MEADALVSYVVQYGLAGIVIYIFYRLISNELRDLKDSINNLNQTIVRLLEKLRC